MYRLSEHTEALTSWQKLLREVTTSIEISRLKLSEIPQLTEREVATIVHGLRLVHKVEGCIDGSCEHFSDLKKLSTDEIETLCAKLSNAPVAPEDAARYTNHFLCPYDDTRWDDRWNSKSNDRCPTCRREIEPYAVTDAKTKSKEILNQATYDRANVIVRGPGGVPTNHEEPLA